MISDRDAQPPQRWRYTSPYRGLSAMEEKDSDYFFGRERETVEVLNVIATESGRLPVLLGNSGVGKVLTRAGRRDRGAAASGWPETPERRSWPTGFQNSRGWCFLTLRARR